MTPPSIPKNGFFFTEHYQWLLGHVRGNLNCRMDAEDTAAETFYLAETLRVQVRHYGPWLTLVSARA